MIKYFLFQNDGRRVWEVCELPQDEMKGFTPVIKANLTEEQMSECIEIALRIKKIDLY